MIVKQIKHEFVPIVITIETQEELNKLFALYNYCPLVRDLDLGSVSRQLTEFKTGAYQKYHDILCQNYTTQEITDDPKNK